MSFHVSFSNLSSACMEFNIFTGQLTSRFNLCALDLLKGKENFPHNTCQIDVRCHSKQFEAPWYYALISLHACTCSFFPVKLSNNFIFIAEAHLHVTHYLKGRFSSGWDGASVI